MMVNQIKAGMQAQSVSITSSWMPPQVQQAIVGSPIMRDKKTDGFVSSDEVAASEQPEQDQSFKTIKAGSIWYAALDTSVKSDEPGPVLATLTTGPLKGSKIIGSFATNNDSLTLTFNQINAKGFDKTLAFNSVAISPKTARTAIASKVDYHYMLKYGGIIATSFLKGLGMAAKLGTSEVQVKETGTTVKAVKATLEDQIMLGAGEVGDALSKNVEQASASVQPTVYIESGTPVGVLLLADFKLSNNK